MSPYKIAVCSRTFSGTPELVEELKKHFSNIKFNNEVELSNEDDLIEFIGDAPAAIIALDPVTEKVLTACPKLEIVSKYGVGLDSIDQEALKRHNVRLGWVGGVNKLSAAEMTLGFMLGLSRNLFKSSYELKAGIWNKDGGFNLSGRTIGIIGVGFIGKEVIRLLKPFNCRILVNDIIDQHEYYESVGVTEVSKEELYAEADIITMHVPATPLTHHLINKETIALMRPNACVINAARGPLVDYAALKEALKSGRIAGAATDVYDEEPPQDTELLSLHNLICTPHIGGNSKEAVIAMGMASIDHLKAYFHGKN
jgi:phosphoglycerate dehydrogenase-like enzyme